MQVTIAQHHCQKTFLKHTTVFFGFLFLSHSCNVHFVPFFVCLRLVVKTQLKGSLFCKSLQLRVSKLMIFKPCLNSYRWRITGLPVTSQTGFYTNLLPIWLSQISLQNINWCVAKTYCIDLGRVYCEFPSLIVKKWSLWVYERSSCSNGSFTIECLLSEPNATNIEIAGC